jgi:WD40 repeat protein
VDDLQGQTIGQYQILEELGRGGMAVVHRAFQPTLQRYVAIKILPARLAFDLEFVERFVQEARAAANLRHPNIVVIYDVGQQAGLYYLVMEYLQGQTLKQLIKQEGPLPPDRVVRIVAQIASALDHAHQEGFIHRDVKPANIFVGRDDLVTLTDFGIAKAAWGAKLTRTGILIGTPEYMSPEQARGEKVDPRTDVYALGVVAYQMLSGREPFSGSTPHAVLYKQVHEPPPPLRTLRPELPPAVAKVVGKALVKDPDARFSTAGNLAKALAGAVKGRAVRVGTKAGPDLRARRTRLLWAVAGLAIVAVIVGLVLTLSGGSEGLLAVTPAVDTESISQAVATKTEARQLIPTATLPPTTAAPSPMATALPPTATWMPTATPQATPSPAVAAVVLAGTPLPQPVAAISAENVDRVTQLARWGKGTAQNSVYSPDGTLLAVASSLGAYLYDATSLEEVRFMATDRWVLSVAFSPDGSMLATGAEGGGLQVWRVSDGRLLSTLEGHPRDVNSVAFSPDGSMLASGSDDAKVRVWQTSGCTGQVKGCGALLYTLGENYRRVAGVAFSPDGTLLASTGDEKVWLWQMPGGQLLRALEGHEKDVQSVAFAPDGETLASGAMDDTIRLWQVSDGTLLRILEGHTSVVTSLAFAPDGATLASGSWDRTVRLWRVADGQALHTLEGHGWFVTSVDFAPDGATLVSGSDMAAGGTDDTVLLWRVSDGQLLQSLEGHTKRVLGLAFSPDGSILASASLDAAVRLWGIAAGDLLRVLTEPGHESLDVTFSPDGSTLASASWEVVWLWSVSTCINKPEECAASTGKLENSRAWAWSVAFSPDGAILASGWQDDVARMWRVADGTLVRTLEGHGDLVSTVAFSPDGETLATGSLDTTVRLWRVADGALLHTLEGHKYLVSSLAFSPDGSLLASGSEDRTVRLWRMPDGELLYTLEGHQHHVSDVAFVPDGSILASASLDRTVRLWRVSDGTLLRTLEGHADFVRSVAISPDGTLLASAGDAGAVRLWGVKP